MMDHNRGCFDGLIGSLCLMGLMIVGLIMLLQLLVMLVQILVGYWYVFLLLAAVPLALGSLFWYRGDIDQSDFW